MPMLYVPRHPQLTEKIGVYGQNGVGKTEVAVSMMRRMTTRHFRIMDTNASYEFAIYDDDEKNKRVIEAQNFTIWTPDNTDWNEQKSAFNEIEEATEPGDWAVFDMLDDCWESVPGWYTRTYLGLDETQYRAMVRLALEEKRNSQQAGGQKGDRTAPLFDQLRDYQHINPEYRKTVYRTMRAINAKGGHVVCMMGSKPVNDNDDKDIRGRYRKYKARPGSQKEVTRELNTIIHLENDGDEFTATVVKDRGGRWAHAFEEEPWTDFGKLYLSPIAGWHMEKVEVAA